MWSEELNPYQPPRAEQSLDETGDRKPSSATSNEQQPSAIAYIGFIVFCAALGFAWSVFLERNAVFGCMIGLGVGVVLGGLAYLEKIQTNNLR